MTKWFADAALRIATCAGVVATAGCAHTPPTNPLNDPIAQALQRSTAQITRAWNQVGAVTEARYPNSLDNLDDYKGQMPVALQQKVSLRWAGPISGVVRKLTHQIGWTYQQNGTPPINALPVFVDCQHGAIGQILRNVGYQAGDRADVVVHPREKLIELDYE